MGDDDGRKIFTGRLPNDITDDEVRYVFNTYGKVLDVRFHEKEGPGGVRSAFVFYDTRHAAESAIKVLHDVYRFREESKEPISVSYPKPRGAHAADRGRDDRGFDRRGADRGNDRAPDRGYDRGGYGGGGGGYDRGGYDRGGYDRGYGRGPERYDRGGYGGRDVDRGGYDRGHQERGHDRGPPPDRRDGRDGYGRDGYGRGGYERRDGYERNDRQRYDNRGRDRSRDRGYGDEPGKGGGKGGGKRGGEGMPGGKLYVANLPADITKDAIDYVFSTYGRVQDIHIMTGRARNGRASGFVIFERHEHARKCILAMQQGYEIRPGEGDIIVKYADDQRDAGAGGRGDGGGRSGRY